MAFTVDLGITYLLFLDQPYPTNGEQVAGEVWSAELLAVLTTLGAFLLLWISDFKILTEIGVFSAVGVTFVLLFVHFVFPTIFPAMPPTAKGSNVQLVKAFEKIAAPANWKLIAVIVFGLMMLFFAKPVFNVDLNAMNSMRKSFCSQCIRTLWGNHSSEASIFRDTGTIF